MSGRTFSHGHIRALDKEHSQIPFQHIPRAVQILLLCRVHGLSKIMHEKWAVSRGVCNRFHRHFHEPYGASAVMGFDLLPGNLARLVLASETWQGLHRERVLLWAGQGKPSEGVLHHLDSRKHSCKMFPSGSTALTQSKRWWHSENTGSQIKCELWQGWSGTQLLCQRHFLNDGNVLMENSTLGLLRSNQANVSWHTQNVLFGTFAPTQTER